MDRSAPVSLVMAPFIDPSLPAICRVCGRPCPKSGADIGPKCAAKFRQPRGRRPAAPDQLAIPEAHMLEPVQHDQVPDVAIAAHQLAVAAAQQGQPHDRRERWEAAMDASRNLTPQILASVAMGMADQEHEELRKRVAELEKDSDRLTALEAAGVDNWEGYGNAFAALDDDEGDA